MKRVTMYMDPKSTHSTAVRKFLEQFLQQYELDLRIHDVRLNPLTTRQLVDLFRYFNLEHFLSPTYEAASGNGDNGSRPNRQEVIDSIARDNSLLRTPIIISGRLMTIGGDLKAISDMLQLRSNGDEPPTKARKGSEG
jgi:arsenate reductase-like glutaredoxin family protein